MRQHIHIHVGGKSKVKDDWKSSVSILKQMATLATRLDGEYRRIVDPGIDKALTLALDKAD